MWMPESQDVFSRAAIWRRELSQGALKRANVVWRLCLVVEGKCCELIGVYRVLCSSPVVEISTNNFAHKRIFIPQNKRVTIIGYARRSFVTASRG